MLGLLHCPPNWCWLRCRVSGTSRDTKRFLWRVWIPEPTQTPLPAVPLNHPLCLHHSINSQLLHRTTASCPHRQGFHLVFWNIPQPSATLNPVVHSTAVHRLLVHLCEQPQNFIFACCHLSICFHLPYGIVFPTSYIHPNFSVPSVFISFAVVCLSQK